MKLTGSQADIAQYQKARGGRGIVSYQGDERWLHRDSKWGKEAAKLWEKKRLHRVLPAGIRNDYAEWAKLYDRYELEVLRSMDA